jgi:hypothetical protein
VLQPIERQIVQQLQSRHPATAWPNAPRRAEIVHMIGEAVAKEKAIDSIAIHPDDPIELLFWGAYDDMTPLHFAMALRTRFGVMVPCEDMLRSCQNHLKVHEVVDDCLRRLGSAPGAA